MRCEVVEVEREREKIVSVRCIFWERGKYLYQQIIGGCWAFDEIAASVVSDGQRKFLLGGFDLTVEAGKRYLVAQGKRAHYLFPILPNVRIEGEYYHFFEKWGDRELHVWIAKNFVEKLLNRYHKPNIEIDMNRVEVLPGITCEKCGSHNLQIFVVTIKEKFGFDERISKKTFYICKACQHKSTATPF